MRTRTGSFEIGVRRGWSDWQKDFDGLIAWLKENEFSVIDVGRDGDTLGKQVVDAGMKIGSVDLAEWQGMLSADPGKRKEAVARNVQYVNDCAKVGAKNHFLVMLPEDPSKPRTENFGYMVESLNMLAPDLERADAKLVIEGWPGPGALCCTPEGYRACFKECPSMSIGVNYDPSHLLRMGIDPVRFAHEFGDRVFHAHGKDTEIIDEAFYEYGTEQPATFGKAHGFGSHHWRYTIPGHGQVRWTEALRALESHGYQGFISIELEDENFNGSEAGEKDGFRLGAQFLSGC
jgi:sugar phosphate isomerase/epimerase